MNPDSGFGDFRRRPMGKATLGFNIAIIVNVNQCKGIFRVKYSFARYICEIWILKRNADIYGRLAFYSH